MIAVNRLTKVYTGHDKKSLTALKNISFTLPDKGLVFITGKSGSGKSTLLNMLGGLDSITKGDIIADGNRFSDFTPVDFDRYRNSYIGFIFQDYCLLEDLTIYQNIELVLDLNGQKNKDRISTILDKVHLSNCETRYPRELSGGQKQRVAIARALAKDPQMFLADEPTGNLDSKTAKSIMKLLKDLSKTKLVVVVSHNLQDAEEYGDRIIELADGVIVRDEQKMEGYEDKLELINGKLILPHLKELTKEEISTMNMWQKKSQIYEFDQRQDGFYPSNNDIKSNKIVQMEKSKLSFGRSFKLAVTFLKRRRLNFVVTALIITCIIAVLGLCQFFVGFDYVKAINDAVMSEGQEIVVGYKSSYIDEETQLLNTSLVYDITNGDLEELEKSGYNSKYYRLYNDAIHIAKTSQLLRQEIRLFSQTNMANFYLLESYGTLSCDDEYLTELFGIDGELVIYGNNSPKDYGILITDYVADSIIYFSNGKYNNYEDLLGLFYENDYDYSHYINGVIETNYEQTYSLFRNKLMDEYNDKILEGKTSAIYQSPEFIDFSEYVEKFLGVSYTYTHNYINSNLNIEAKNYTRLDYSYISSSELDAPYYFSNILGYMDQCNPNINKNLDANTIAMSTKAFNAIFNTNYDSTNYMQYSKDKVIDISKCARLEKDLSKSKITQKLQIVELFDSSNNIIIFDESNFMNFRQFDVFDYALYFDNISEIGLLYNFAKMGAFDIDSEAFKSISTIIDVVDIFEDFFNIISIVLYCACFLMLVNFGAGNIRKRKFEIGVIKSMGGQTKQVGKVFIIQLVSVGLIVCLLSSLTLVFLSDIVNGVLSNAMLQFVHAETLKNISVIQFDGLVLLGDILMIIGITLLSAIIPLYKLHKIKPINIIKHKN